MNDYVGRQIGDAQRLLAARAIVGEDRMTDCDAAPGGDEIGERKTGGIDSETGLERRAGLAQLVA